MNNISELLYFVPICMHFYLYINIYIVFIITFLKFLINLFQMRKFQHHRNFSRQKEVDVCSYPFGGWNNSNLFYLESTVRFYDILLVVFCVFPIANLTGKKVIQIKK